jgi:hypothetical protein
LYVTVDLLPSPGLLADGLASRSGSDIDEGLVESAGLAGGLVGSCLVCSVCNTGLVAEPERGLE